MDIALLVFAAAVVGSAIGPLVSALLNLRASHMERKAAQRTERLEYLDGKLQALIEARARAIAASGIGRDSNLHIAVAIVLSTVDDEMDNKIKTAIESGSWDDKMEAINSAIEALGRMTMKIVRDD